MAAAALLLNTQNEILIVKPIYRERWLLPGGVVEKNESPRQACIREVREELELDVAVGKLLCVDYKIQQGSREEGIEFVFFGLFIPPLPHVVARERENHATYSLLYSHMEYTTTHTYQLLS